MFESIKKLFHDDFALYIFFLVMLVLSWILPKTGPLVMVDEFFDTVIVWVLVVIIIKKIINICQSSLHLQKAWKIPIIIVGILVMVWVTINFVSDITYGPKSISVQNVELSKYQGRFGFISLHYYISGIDENGNKLRFEISADDYSRLSNRSSASIVYYERTKRVVNAN